MRKCDTVTGLEAHFMLAVKELGRSARSDLHHLDLVRKHRAGRDASLQEHIHAPAKPNVQRITLFLVFNPWEVFIYMGGLVRTSPVVLHPGCLVGLNPKKTPKPTS